MEVKYGRMSTLSRGFNLYSDIQCADDVEVILPQEAGEKLTINAIFALTSDLKVSSSFLVLATERIWIKELIKN